MWITDEDEGGFSIEERRLSESQEGLFSTDVYGADFLHQRSDERSSRPAKRARLLNTSGTDGGQVIRKGHVGGKTQAEPRITNGHRSRSGEGMKVTAHEKRGVLKYGNNTMQQQDDDDDDAVSTSGDESLFVVQVRSPASKQLLHGRKRSIDHNGRSRSIDHNDGSICNGARSPVITDLRKSGVVQSEAKTSPDFVYRKRMSAVKNPTPLEPLEALTAEGPSNGPDKNSEQTRAHIAENGCTPKVYSSKQRHSGLIKNARKMVETGNVEIDIASTSRLEKTSNAAEEPSAKEATEAVNVYVRKRKRSDALEVASEAAVEQSKTEDPSGGEKIKHYVRRPHRQLDSHIPADVVEKPLTETHDAPGLHVFQRRPKKEVQQHEEQQLPVEGNLNVFHRRPKKKVDEQQQPVEGNLNVFHRRPKKISLPEHADGTETEANLNVFHRRPKKDPLLQAEHHVDVPAEGNLNVFQRRSKMKEPDMGNEGHNILSPLGYVRADHQPSWLPEGWTLEIRQGDPTARTKDKYYHDHKSGHIFRSKSEVLQFLEGGGVVPLQYKKRLPETPSKHSGFHTPISQPEFASPSSQFINLQPARMKTTPTCAVPSEANGTSTPKPPSDPVWSSRDGADHRPANDSRLQLPTESPVSKSPSEQADKENRGKLIFRLKRKHPDSSEGGKGRSKRPMYEVVHVGKASSSTTSTPTKPTPTKQDEKKVAEEAVPATPLQTRVESPSVVVVPSSMKTTQVEKPTPVESFCPSPVVIEQQKQPGQENWGPIMHQHLFEHQQQEPYTALGIPATAKSSGLKSYSTNHTHVFCDPVTNSLPLSWQSSYPFTIHAPIPSSTAPAPVFEHFQGVSVNAATATVVPCSDSGVKRDSAAAAAAAKVASKSLSKEGQAKVLLDLGRRVCLAGVEQNKRSLTPEGKRTSL